MSGGRWVVKNLKIKRVDKLVHLQEWEAEKAQHAREMIKERQARYSTAFYMDGRATGVHRGGYSQLQ